jgi:TonB family protein
MVLQVRPTEARAAVGGQVTLQCFLTPEGTTTGCRAANENPPDVGFGRAAFLLSRSFSVKFEPGAAPEAGKLMVVIPVQFPPTSGGLPPLSEVRFSRGLAPGASQQLFPAAAKAANVSVGVGTVDCLVAAAGELTDCKVTAEEPVGLGFGSAAIEASRQLAVKLWTSSGQAVEGRRIALPLRLRAETAPPRP